MPDAREVMDRLMSWMSSNTRLSYLLPDSVEAVFYLCLAAYFAVLLAQ